MGAVVHLVDLFTGWNEGQVREAIERSFNGMIDDSKPTPRFEFLKALGKSLVRPNVPHGSTQEWTGERVRQIAGQGDIYIRATYPLNLDGLPDCYGLNDITDQETTTSNIPECENNPGTSTGHLDHSVIDVSPPVSCYAGTAHNTTSIPVESCQDPVSLVLSVVGSSHSIDEVKEVLQRNYGDADTSVNELLDNSSSHLHSIPGPSTSVFPSSQISVTSPSLAEILRAHCQKTISNRVYDMEIDRSRLWQQASIFYKHALQSPECLSYKFAVEFIGEEGVDAGAIKNEFFEQLLGYVNDVWFEGAPSSRLPKKDWGHDLNMETAGAMIAHSITQSGPGFPFLCPAVVSFLFTLNVDAAMNSLPSVADIPHNLSTADLINLLLELDQVTTQEQLDKLFETEKNMTIVNTSGWSITKEITLQSKNMLIQNLIYDEVIGKRERYIRALRRGLTHLGVLDMLLSNQEKTSQLFLHQESGVTYETIRTCIKVPSVLSTKEETVVQWLFNYLKSRDNMDPSNNINTATLPQFLKFVTGMGAFPPGHNPTITLMFHRDFCSENPLAEAQTCFGHLYLPTTHTDEEIFAQFMDKSILMSIGYFGLC